MILSSVVISRFSVFVHCRDLCTFKAAPRLHEGSNVAVSVYSVGEMFDGNLQLTFIGYCIFSHQLTMKTQFVQIEFSSANVCELNGVSV